MEFKNIDSLVQYAKQKKLRKRLAVAAAADLHVLEAVCHA